MNIARSIELYARASALMPGGVNSPVRAFKSVGGTPLFIAKGTGSRVYDEDGNAYIDYCMSWGPLLLGHADDDVVRAIADAARDGTSFGTPNRREVEIAELVIARFPAVDKVRFVNSGTEAVMSAIRLARGFTGRDKVVKFDGCYHGHADSMLVAAGSGLATFGTPDSAGVTEGAAHDTIVVPFNDIDALRAVMQRDHHSIAAVIMEPVPCNYGLIPPRDGYLRAVRELCDRSGALLIFDEVITGLRLAPGGAQERFDVRPDITTLGKIIGGGLPVGAYGASTEIMAKVAPDGPVYQAGTLSGNPLAMAAGIATMKKIDALNAYDLLEEKGRRFDALVAPIADEYRGRALILRLGSIVCTYFTERTSIESVDQVRACDMKRFARYHAEMLRRGIYLAPSGYEVGFLATAHTDDDLADTAAAMRESLAAAFGS
ncbi:MAG TPA: glutamate-1-semialdehyde 2,1-aminomutase [Spirochaetota bacterium]|nr:glutamate-1-semialdehyde 2,1-aminomutase [Spirochaetota bacterium]HNT13178.1 glutamate-1-semialdehyde 2,1-aminomutase [Spirochaetota bacterium]